MKILKLIDKITKKHIPIILLALLLSMMTILSNVGMISTSSVLISKAGLHPEVLDLMVLIVAVRFFGISRGVFRYAERLVSHNTTFKILSSLRRWVFKNFNENFSENNKNFKTGSIYTTLVNDVDVLKDFFLSVIYPLSTAILVGIVTSIFIAFYSYNVLITYIIFYIISGFILPVLLYIFNLRLTQKENLLRKKINVLLLDALNGILEISIYEMKDRFMSNYNLIKNQLFEIENKKNFILVAGENIYSLLITLLMTAVLIETAPSVFSGQLNGIYYAMLPLAIMSSFEALIPMPNILYKYNESKASASSLISILSSPKQTHENETCKKTVSASNLSIHNISVKDTYSEKYLLDNISFELPLGKKIAIVGSSGSGKSTLLKALLGFIKYDSGNILIDNSSYSELNIDYIRQLFSYVEQDPYVFNTTIIENLRIAVPNIDEVSILQATDNAQITNFIKMLPNGMQTLLGQLGSKISGGEKQRLAIARALLKNSDIMLFDEPTASLDIGLEKKVINSVFNFLNNKSCIWVTHRLIGLNKMDEILVLEDGKIVERGTESFLLSQKGVYYKLWCLQRQYLI